MNKNQKKNKPKEYLIDFLELREIVNSYDPLGLIKGGAPEDEHDKLTSELQNLLCGNKLNEIRPLLINCYEWYGSDPNEIKDEYVERFQKKVDETLNRIMGWYKHKNDHE
ncbi:hypothetical protein [Paenibacillus sp. Leaf72]|uniref:hypothetical protein n=1 Tax=Paenibacillus sp. Leaf72 TaxID=1736234 RepID=UPI0006FA6870|nr:hypothetical protein [Paenibacillus sp. Leaf72]KQN98957.1 hypothetical protein ASF12_19410 [Paenibacillus sp. Leaf72]